MASSNTALLPARGGIRAQAPADRLEAIIQAFFARRSPRTREAYGRALQDLAGWMNEADGVRAILVLIGRGDEHAQGEANLRVMEYMADLKGRGLSPASMNQRLAAVKSMVKLARQAGLVSWSLEVEGEKAQAYRDTRGPGVVAVDALLRRLAGMATRKAVRDFALLRLLFDLGLRRAELVSLDLDHLDLQGRRLSIQGKGRSGREPLTLPEPTAAALSRWLELRGSEPGPLFSSLDHAGKGSGRLTADGLYKLLKCYGRALGFDLRPHGIRHTAITRAGELTNGNLVAMASFSRHKKLDVLGKYLDNMKDLQGETAALLAGTICLTKGEK